MAFDFTAHMAQVIADIAAHCPEFAHIDCSRLLTCFAQSRTCGTRGVYAKIAPLRFEGGADVVEQHGCVWQMPNIKHEGREVLYLIYFYLPRFCNLTLESKLVTIFHELYHISPEFNGDLRRLPGRNWAHGHSRKAYNEKMRALVHKYLALPPTDGLLRPLEVDFAALVARHGGVVGRRMIMPKPIALNSGR